MAAMNSANSIDVKGTGPGLACYTPKVLDYCAVLEFAPSDNGHILTRAYGVIEMQGAQSLQAAVEKLVGDDAVAAFESFTVKLGYDPVEVKQGMAVQYGGNGGVTAYAAGAGVTQEEAPFYDPLENTLSVNAINREIAVFAIDGAEARVPIIFVLQ